MAFCVVLSVEQPSNEVCSDRKERGLHIDFCGMAFCVVLSVGQSSDRVCSDRKEIRLHIDFCGVAFCVVLSVEQPSNEVCSDRKETALHKGFCGVAFCVMLTAQQSSDEVCSDRKERRASDSDLYKLICRGFCVGTRKTMPTVEENTDSGKRKSNVNTAKLCVYLSNVEGKSKLEEARCINETVIFFFFFLSSSREIISNFVLVGIICYCCYS
jgi:hypothetical protein